MFFIAEFKDAISVQPKHLHKPKFQAIEDEINAKYANKVFHNVGLCICAHEITCAADGLVQHSEGSTYYKVQFRMMVFCPFPGQVLVGRILSSSLQGLHISLGFFDDILVPPAMLPTPHRFDEEDQVWIWDYEGTPLYLDAEDIVRLQVQSVLFKEVRPDAAKRSEIDNSVNVVPFQVIANMAGPGMGPLSWWHQSD